MQLAGHPGSGLIALPKAKVALACAGAAGLAGSTMISGGLVSGQGPVGIGAAQGFGAMMVGIGAAVAVLCMLKPRASLAWAFAFLGSTGLQFGVALVVGLILWQALYAQGGTASAREVPTRDILIWYWGSFALTGIAGLAALTCVMRGIVGTGALGHSAGAGGPSKHELRATVLGKTELTQ